MKKVSKKPVNKGIVSNIVSVNEEKIQSHVDHVVRSMFETAIIERYRRRDRFNNYRPETRTC